MGLNEKTLELNISAEFLNICRRYDPRAFMFGTTLQQESRFGYDSRALGNLPPFWRTAIFQFKRALFKRKSVFGDEYTFHINNNTHRDQHVLLYLMSGGRPLTSLYVLPLFTTLNDVRSQSPSLLAQTVFVDAAGIPPWFVNNTPHTLLVYPRQNSAVVLSERKEVKILNSEEIIKNVSEKKIGVTIEELCRNIKIEQVEGAETRSTRPRFVFHVFPQ